MKTLVHVLGLNHTEYSYDEWKIGMWGTIQEGLFGRLSYGIVRALEKMQNGHTVYVYSGNGPDRSEDGRCQAQFTKHFLETHLHELPGYSREVAEWFQTHVYFESELGQNTELEIRSAVRYALGLGCGALLVVTSPGHISRVGKHLAIEHKKLRREERLSLRVRPEFAYVDVPGRLVDRVLVQEYIEKKEVE